MIELAGRAAEVERYEDGAQALEGTEEENGLGLVVREHGHAVAARDPVSGAQPRGQGAGPLEEFAVGKGAAGVGAKQRRALRRALRPALQPIDLDSLLLHAAP